MLRELAVTIPHKKQPVSQMQLFLILIEFELCTTSLRERSVRVLDQQGPEQTHVHSKDKPSDGFSVRHLDNRCL